MLTFTAADNYSIARAGRCGVGCVVSESEVREVVWGADVESMYVRARGYGTGFETPTCGLEIEIEIVAIGMFGMFWGEGRVVCIRDRARAVARVLVAGLGRTVCTNA